MSRTSQLLRQYELWRSSSKSPVTSPSYLNLSRAGLRGMLCSDDPAFEHRQVIEANIIDKINILEASLLAMEQAVHSLEGNEPDFILIDGNQQPKVCPSSSIERSQPLCKADRLLILFLCAET